MYYKSSGKKHARKNVIHTNSCSTSYLMIIINFTFRMRTKLTKML